MTKLEKIEIALMESRRFIQRATAWKRRLKSDSISGSKEGGAAKRSSLDLTRALADLRKSEY